MSGLDRLLRPRSIAVVGGGGWCANVIRECRRIGFDGALWPVHPDRSEVAGLPAFATVQDLPGAPDACFIGVNRSATVDVVRALAQRGAGGAVCFASGFREAAGELADGPALQDRLQDAAGQMPFLGPNCYGFINALDGAALWPDQHGLSAVDSGVAILTQSSNIALNLTMQRRGLPIAYLGTVGNQARVDLAMLGMAVLEDPRVTALGLHIEGVRDIRAFEALALRARALGKRIVALKVGASDQASAAAVSHTASLAGSEAGARALLARLGIARVNSLGALLEALKILHCAGPLSSNAVVSMSCSGGEASLMADSALQAKVVFPALGKRQREGLRAALGPKVSLANPLDYHTYVWPDVDRMAACFGAMMAAEAIGIGTLVLDFPRPDRCDGADWDRALDAAERAARGAGAPLAILASLPDTLPEERAHDIMARGLVPLCGIPEALEAIAAAAFLGSDLPDAEPVLLAAALPALPAQAGANPVMPEGQAKAALAGFGVTVPALERVQDPQGAAAAAERIGFPVVLKAEGLAHKSEAGAVRLGLRSAADVVRAAEEMVGACFLVEERIDGAVAELLIGVQRDPAHGFVLSLGAGGVFAEILGDVQSLLLPVSRADIDAALERLKCAPLLAGYRGAAPADKAAIACAVLAVQDYVTANADWVQEVEVNPLLCLPQGAVAVDALITGEAKR